jgi:hypothetical protein
MRSLSWFLREPLVHFVIIGVLIFVLFMGLNDPPPDQGPGNTIIVELELIEQLTASFQAVWLRAPNEDERRALIDNFVREEIYYREALTLGLDRNDAMVRRRLQQKMEFLTDSGADLLEPVAGELEAHLLANPQTFGRPPLLAFEQIYLGATADSQSVERSLLALQSDPATDHTTLGERTLLPAVLSLSPSVAIDGVFGLGFFEQVAELPPTLWAGPVESSYGLHLIRILDNQPAEMPPLEQVHDAVLRDWKASKAMEVRELYYARLRERYVVEIHDANSPTEEND